MKVFCDYHHADLFYSFHLLFEKRLGWELYRPIGLEWYTSGFWKYHKWLDVVKQYLAPRGDEILKDGYYICPDPTHQSTTKAVTFEQFRKMKFDVIIASVPENTECYWELRRQFQPKAKLIQQVGNQWSEFDFSFIQNMMFSTLPCEVPDNVKVVFYRQEFDLTEFRPSPPPEKLKIKNFVNCLREMRDGYLWDAYKKELPEFDWKMYGIGGDDGNIAGTNNVAASMRDCHFTFHLKQHGDGFGHIIHNTFACGRPPIIKGEYYRDRLAGALIEDNKTCIDIDKASFQENILRIRFWAMPENYRKMSAAAFRRFREVVNFDREFLEVKKFLENLK